MTLFADAAVHAATLLLQTVPAVILGVVAAEILMALRFTERISRAARPITAFAHLPPESGVSFMTAFFSSQAADAMLVDYHHTGRLGERELKLSALMNSFPAIVMHWRYLLPVYLPLMGIYGLIYFLILTAVGFAKTAIILVAGHLLLPPRGAVETGTEEGAGVVRAVSARAVLRDALAASAQTLRRILVIMIPTLVLVALLIEGGVFEAIGAYLGRVSGYFPIPAEGIGIVAAKLGSFVAAASVASALLAAGDISGRDAVLALLVGNLLSSVIYSFRWLGSFYIAIFGVRLGTQIMIVSTLLQNGLVLAAIFLLAWLW